MWDSKRGPGHAELGPGGSVGSFMMVSVCSSMDLWGFFGLYLASQMELELQVEKAALGGGWQPAWPWWHTRKARPCPLCCGGLSKRPSLNLPSESPPPAQVRSGERQVLFLLAVLEMGLLMLGILHNFIDLFST